MRHPLPTGPGEDLHYVDGRPLYPYAAPFVRHAGRFVDSLHVRDEHREPRTLRANGISIRSGRVYGRIGAHLVRWDEFFGDLGKPLRSTLIKSSTRLGGIAEAYLPWERHCYPEQDSRWDTYLWDGQDRLYDYAFDARGRVYAAYSPWGYGVLDDDLRLLHQSDPASMLAAFRVGSRYYLATQADLYDVTDEPVRIRAIGRTSAICASMGAVAVADGGALRIYDAAGFVSGGAPLLSTAGAPVTSLETDGARIYAVRGAQPGAVSSSVTVYDDRGSVVTSRTFPGMSWLRARHGSGHLAIVGRGPDKLEGVWLLRADTLEPVDLGHYVTRHYFRQSATWHVPQGTAGGVNANEALYHRHGGKEYLILSFRGLGDVYEIDTGMSPVEPDPAPDPIPDPDPTPDPEPDPEPEEPPVSCEAEKRQIAILEAEIARLNEALNVIDEPDKVVDEHTALLLGRFHATVRYRGAFDAGDVDTDAHVKSVRGFADTHFQTVFFTFNSQANIEVMVKMLDQGNTDAEGNPTVAVLIGTATPLAVEVTITDTKTGATRIYSSAFGSMRGAVDWAAFRR